MHFSKAFVFLTTIYGNKTTLVLLVEGLYNQSLEEKKIVQQNQKKIVLKHNKISRTYLVLFISSGVE